MEKGAVMQTTGSIFCTGVCTAQQALGLTAGHQDFFWDLEKPEFATVASLFPSLPPLPATTTRVQ